MPLQSQQQLLLLRQQSKPVKSATRISFVKPGNYTRIKLIKYHQKNHVAIVSYHNLHCCFETTAGSGRLQDDIPSLIQSKQREKACHSTMISSGIDEDDETVDPRIEDKLEELNSWTDRINSLEKEFDEANAIFRSFLTEYSDKLKIFGRKIGSKSIQEARVYYEAKDRAAAAQCRCQKTVVAYEKACQMLLQAKGEIELTERKFQSSNLTQSESLKRRSSSPRDRQDFDVLWQEMLNQATLKLQEAEQLKRKSKEEHEESMKEFMVAEDELSRLDRKLKSVIKKTQPYFDESFKFKQHLLKLKEEIEQLNRKIVTSKSFYATTLRDLEGISEEIHKRRSLKLLRPLDSPGHGSESTEDKGTEEESRRRFSSPDFRDIVPELSLDSARFHIEVKPTALAVLSPQDLVDRAFNHSISTNSTNTSSCSVSHIDNVLEQSVTSRPETSRSAAEAAALTFDKLNLSGFDEVNLDWHTFLRQTVYILVTPINVLCVETINRYNKLLSRWSKTCWNIFFTFIGFVLNSEKESRCFAKQWWFWEFAINFVDLNRSIDLVDTKKIRFEGWVINCLSVFAC